MGKDYISIGAAPAEEMPVQVGHPDYYRLAIAECNRYIRLIRRDLGPEPEGARLAIKAFPHDYGTYHEVVCWYESDLPESVKYAHRCEREVSSKWPTITMEDMRARIVDPLEQLAISQFAALRSRLEGHQCSQQNDKNCKCWFCSTSRLVTEGEELLVRLRNLQ